MKKLLAILTFFTIYSSAAAQNLNVSATSASKNNSTTQFNVKDGTVTINGEAFAFAKSAVSSDAAPSGIAVSIEDTGISIYSSEGSKLYGVNYKRANDDNSTKIYVANNGAFVIRENVANFLFYDSTGKIQRSISNSSQSSEGESVSQFASDPAFKTRVLYNPEIINGGVKGSRARIINENGTLKTFFNRDEQAIRFVEVSEAGQFIAVVSHQENRDEVYITDRFGNEIITIPFDQEVEGVSFSEGGSYITIYSNSRAGAYDLITGERVGSTSFRTPLKIAEFFPEDNVILALTADESNSILSNIEIHAINISERKIERREFNERLGTTELLSQKITRTGKYNYRLSGLSKILDIRASF